LDVHSFPTRRSSDLHLLTLIGGYYVSKGQIDQSSVDTVIGGLTGIAGVAWSVKYKLG
jgi:hypothetical protein